MRTLRIIVSFDADQYPELTGKEICDTLVRDIGAEVASAYKAIPSYLNTKVEVVDEAVVDKEG
jgi:hypothetical protein